MATEAPRARTFRLPKWAFGVLVVVTSITVGVATTSTWLHQTTTDTDKFVDRVAPVASDPAVEAALGTWAAAELREVVDLEGFFEDVLPDKGQILAPVLANAVQGFLAEEATKVFASDAFDQVWETALTRAHKAAMKVLRGGGDNVSVENGKVVLHLTPLLNQVLTSVEQRISGLFGKDVDLPEIDPDAPPSEAVTTLETALGKSLPDDFGEIEVFDSEQLGTMQLALEYFDRGVVVLLVLAVVLLALTIALAPDRRKGVLYLAVGIAVVTVVQRRLTFAGERELLDQFKVEQNRDAANAIIDQIFSSYLGITATILTVCVVAWLVAFLAGPGRLPVALRRSVTKVGVTTADAADDVTWLRDHVGLLRIGVLVAAGLLILFTALSFVGLLIVGVIVGLLEAWLGLVSRGGTDVSPRAR